MLVGDDVHAALRSGRFHGQSLRRYLARCKAAAIVACEPVVSVYREIASLAVLKCEDVVLIETRPERKAEWLAAVRASASADVAMILHRGAERIGLMAEVVTYSRRMYREKLPGARVGRDLGYFCVERLAGYHVVSRTRCPTRAWAQEAAARIAREEGIALLPEWEPPRCRVGEINDRRFLQDDPDGDGAA